MQLHRIGVAIRRRRLQLGLSQTELGERAGVHRMSLTKIERGYGLPTLPVLSRIADALHCEISVRFKAV